MLKPAFGAISMLLALLILGIMAAMMLPALKSASGAGVGGTSLKQESAQEKAADMINKIEQQRQFSRDYYERKSE